MTMALLREAVGSSLRAARTEQSRTLRDVAREARVSLGYLSEVERGQKEASSELLNSICEALGLQLSALMSDVTSQIASSEIAKLTAEIESLKNPVKREPRRILTTPTQLEAAKRGYGTFTTEGVNLSYTIEFIEVLK